MSTPDELPPAPSEAVSAFLAEHAHTGTPSDAELQRGKERLVAALAKPPVAEVVPLHATRRSWVPPEVLAVAAVLLLAVAGQVLYVALRDPPPEAPSSDGQWAQVVAAYRRSDVKGVQHLASSSCTSAQCVSMGSKLLRALELSGRFDGLMDAELDELGRLDAELSGGAETDLKRAIDDRRQGVKATPEQLLASARERLRQEDFEGGLSQLERCLTVAPKHPECDRVLRAALLDQESLAARLERETVSLRDQKKFDDAVKTAERCVEIAPARAHCHRQLGLTLLARFAGSHHPDDREAGSVALRRFLQLASPDDAEVAAVQALLDGGAAQQRAEDPLAELYARALALEKTDAVQSLRLLRRVVDESKAGDPLQATARQELERRLKVLQAQVDARRPPRSEAREVYLRAYQLKESQPEEAVRLFKQVLEMTPPEDETHQKAKSRIAELSDREPEETSSAGQHTIRVGEKLVLQIPGMTRIAVGDASTVDVFAIGGNQLKIVGAAPGTTTVLVWRHNSPRMSLTIVVR